MMSGGIGVGVAGPTGIALPDFPSAGEIFSSYP